VLLRLLVTSLCPEVSIFRRVSEVHSQVN
jgi:hypothetical protein